MLFKKQDIINYKKNCLSNITEDQTIEQRIENLENLVLKLLHVMESYAVTCPNIKVASEILTSEFIGTETKHMKAKF